MKNKIKVFRAMNDYTQADLAAKADVSAWTINAMEANKYAPSITLAIRIARVFNVNVEEVFIFEEEDMVSKRK